MENPFERMSRERAAVISMREIEKGLANRKRATPSEFQSQSQCSAGRSEKKKQRALLSALNIDGPRSPLATLIKRESLWSAPNLARADKEKVTTRSGEATECSDDTSVPAGSSIEVTRLNGAVLHSDKLLITRQMAGLRNDTLETCAMLMNVPRGAADVVISCIEKCTDGQLMVRFIFRYEKIADDVYTKKQDESVTFDYCLVCLDPAVEDAEVNCIRCDPCTLCDRCKVKIGDSNVCLQCIKEDEIGRLSDTQRVRCYCVGDFEWDTLFTSMPRPGETL